MEKRKGEKKMKIRRVKKIPGRPRPGPWKEEALHLLSKPGTWCISFDSIRELNNTYNRLSYHIRQNTRRTKYKNVVKQRVTRNSYSVYVETTKKMGMEK